MTDQPTAYEPSQDERILASLAHGSILLGVFTNGLGGIATSLLIWLTQRERSDYVARQALQALVYQIGAFVVILTAFGCWGLAWLGLSLPPLLANPEAYQAGPPPSMIGGMVLLLCPLAFGLLTTLYGLYGAARCLIGSDFAYALIGPWLSRQR